MKMNIVESLKNVHKYSNEKERIYYCIVNELKKINKRDLFIDVGFGDGYLTKKVSRHFKKTIAVDIYLTKLKNKKITCVNDFHKITDKADFILLSYVLKADLKQNAVLIESAISKLSNGGVICIVSLSENSLIIKKYKQIASARNSFDKMVLISNNLSVNQNIINSNYNFPLRKESFFCNLFNVSNLNDFLTNLIITKKRINFSLLHNIFFATKNPKNKLFLFSGLVATGKTSSAKKFAELKKAQYFNLDSYLRKLAKEANVEFNKFLINITKVNKLTIAKLIISTLMGMLDEHTQIVVDGVFSLEEIEYIKKNLNAQVMAIYIDCKFDLRCVRSKRRLYKKHMSPKRYLYLTDKISNSYGGGQYSPLVFNYYIDNNSLSKEDLIKKLKNLILELNCFSRYGQE